MTLLIRNGRILDPANYCDEMADLLIEEGKIAAVGHYIETPAMDVIDAAGKVIVPGFVDIHTHLREPGREDKESIASGTRAAAAGGYTTVCPMPNTDPVCDSTQSLQFLASRARDTAVVNIFPIAAVTKGQKGEQINEFGDLVYYGAVAFSDDGHPIMNAEIMRLALEYTSMFDVPVLDHCEDLNLSENGQMRAGEIAMKLGLKGIPAAANSSQVARDIDLADYTGGHVHICHVAVQHELDYIRTAKEKGVRVTCEVTPHHLTLTDESLLTYDTNFKMAPPLGHEDDRRALIEALREGVIDCVATDHAPHTEMEKDRVMQEAPFGVIGLESAFSVLYTDLVLKGEIELPVLIERMTIGPSRILQLKTGTLSEGADADVAILDLDTPYTFEASMLHSRSQNSPYLGRELRGRAVATLVGGRVVFSEGKIIE